MPWRLGQLLSPDTISDAALQAFLAHDLGTIGVLKTAVQRTKLGQSEELAAIKRLDDQARRLERHASGPSVEALFAHERANSQQYGGRSVFGVEPPPNGSTRRMGERTE
jgi:hypothetical protein